VEERRSTVPVDIQDITHTTSRSEVEFRYGQVCGRRREDPTAPAVLPRHGTQVGFGHAHEARLLTTDSRPDDGMGVMGSDAMTGR
jgi:hypothetical protein